MQYYNIFDLKLQDLHVFIAVAEYQSITKAADYLYITPSQVSKIVRKLEQQWGVQLFIRDKNTIRLTPAGRHAFSGLQKTVRNVEKVLDETIHIQKVTPFIRAGCPNLSDPNELFVPIVKKFLKSYPDTSITIECSDTLSNLRRMLIGGDIDLIYTSNHEVSSCEDIIEWRAVEKLPMYIIMNKDHKLASDKEIELSEVEFEKFVLINPTSEMHPDYTVNLCKQHGFIPRVAQYTQNIYSQLMAIHLDPSFICIQTAKTSESDSGLCCRRLVGVDWDMGFAFRKDSAKIVYEFVDCAVNCITNN